MLQQTRVRAMEHRYRAFVERFPDPASLARVAEDDAVAAWSGLGYYRRARFLHRTARMIEADGFPRDAAGLKELPGVGEYTASAVASIAFGEPVPAIDGNVVRVLARWFRISGRDVRSAAARLMESGGAEDPGEWNQALMELGALVCLPRSPRCGACPVESVCAARAEGCVDAYPERPPRPSPERVRFVEAVVADAEGRVLVFRRTEPPLEGMWELPGGACRPGEEPEAALRRVARGYGMRVRGLAPLPEFRHAIMNRRYRVIPFRAALDGPKPPPGRFVSEADLDRIPSGSLLAKTLAGGGYTPAPTDPT